MTILDRICTEKKAHVERKKQEKSLEILKEHILKQYDTRCFKSHILRNAHDTNTALICEIKKASPSAGLIRDDFNVPQIAAAYETGGAACLSVLTDEPFFQGDDAYIQEAKNASALPVLRKDFIVDSYQIYESRALGADCILLIMAALNDDQASGFLTLARDLGMDALVEIHDREELERAKAIGADMIGVNNRNLKTMAVSLQTSIDLAAHMPQEAVRIAESGIYSYEEIKVLQDAGYQGFLIGESLMQQEDLVAAVKSLTGTGLDTKHELK